MQRFKKMVRDWYYKQNCKAEDELFDAYVDVVNEREHEQNAKKR